MPPRWLWRLLAALTVALLGLLVASGPASAFQSQPAATFTAYAYDHPDGSDILAGATTERGPPATYNHSTIYDAVGRWSRGVLARPDGTTRPTAFTHDHPALLVRVSRPWGMTEEQARVLGGDLPSVCSPRVAAKAVPETLNFGSRAAAREGLPGDLAAVGNRFFRGATGKSQDFQAVGLPGGGYRLQFFSPANNPGYGKLYVQEIDRGGNVVSRYKDTIGPDGFIERKPVQ